MHDLLCSLDVSKAPCNAKDVENLREKQKHDHIERNVRAFTPEEACLPGDSDYDVATYIDDIDVQ